MRRRRTLPHASLVAQPGIHVVRQMDMQIRPTISRISARISCAIVTTVATVRRAVVKVKHAVRKVDSINLTARAQKAWDAQRERATNYAVVATLVVKAKFAFLQVLAIMCAYGMERVRVIARLIQAEHGVGI